MSDSKGELKRYTTEYETETGKRWWTNPVSHGEQGFASDDFLYWFAFALSTAEQRIEELEKEKARWVSVKDRRPTKVDVYAVIVKPEVRQPEISVALFDDNGEWFQNDDWRVTHWLDGVPPLPEGK